MADTDPAPHVFNASMGARLEVLYASPQIVAQRRRFRALLDVRQGESGVDVGCGVGHLTCELAEDVGIGGRMTGIDASTDMLAGAAARVHARRLGDRVALREGDAIALGLPDASADFVVAVQTYSYAPTSLRRLPRRHAFCARAAASACSRPTGISIYASPDVDLMRRIFDGRWRFEHAHLPRRLNRLFADAGLTPTHAEAFPLLETSYDPDSFGAGMLALGRNAAVRHGVDRAAADAWVADVRARGERGDWFFCLNRFMFVATKT